MGIGGLESSGSGRDRDELEQTDEDWRGDMMNRGRPTANTMNSKEQFKSLSLFVQ